MSGNSLFTAIVLFQIEGYDALSTIAYGCAKLLLAVVVLAVLIALLVQALRDLGLRYLLQRNWVRSWLETRAKAYIKSKQSYEDKEPRDPTDKDKEPRDPTDLAKSAEDEIRGLVRRASVFSLSPGQLCGQLSARIQSLLNDDRTTYLMRLFVFEVSDDSGKGRDEEAPQSLSDKGSNGQTPRKDSDTMRRLDRIERAIDDLQLYLDQRWRIFDYFIGVFFASVLMALSIFWVQRTTGEVIRPTPLTLYAVVSIFASLLVPQVRPLIERLTRPRL